MRIVRIYSIVFHVDKDMWKITFLYKDSRMSKIFFRDIDTRERSTALKIARDDIVDYPCTKVIKIEKVVNRNMKNIVIKTVIVLASCVLWIVVIKMILFLENN